MSRRSAPKVSAPARQGKSARDNRFPIACHVKQDDVISARSGEPRSKRHSDGRYFYLTERPGRQRDLKIPLFQSVPGPRPANDDWEPPALRIADVDHEWRVRAGTAAGPPPPAADGVTDHGEGAP